MKYLAILAIAACGVVAACDSPTLPPRSNSDVYDFRLQSDTSHIFHWPAGSRINVFVHGTSPAKIDSLAKSFERGAAQWNMFALFGEYQLVRASALSEADIVIRWSDDLAPVDDSACTPTFSSGVTTFCIEDLEATPLRLETFPQRGTPDPAARGVKMLVTILASQATIPGRVDRLVAHELGHVLGIGKHSPVTTDLMYPDPSRANLSRRDVATIQVLYHTDADIFP